MRIQGDTRAIPFYVQALLEHECQFFLTHENGKKVRVAFKKGSWKLMRENGDSFEVDDSVSVIECKNPVLKAFIEQRIESLFLKFNDFIRTYPAMVIVDTLEIWFGNLEGVTEISVTKASRDGWFYEFSE